MSKPFSFFQIKRIEDPKFIMIPIEFKDFIEFEVKRLYFITDPIKDRRVTLP